MALFDLKYYRAVRLVLLMLTDLATLSFAFWISYVIRLEDFNISRRITDFERSLPIFVLTHVVVFHLGGMYRQVWRYANFHNALLIAKLTFIATIVSIFLIYVLKIPQPPRSVPIIFWLFATMATIGNKFSWRLWITMRENIGPKGKEKCLVYGAGSAGELLARHAVANPNFPYRIVGFIDDDKNKRNRVVHGIKILGTGEDVAKIALTKNVKTIIIALHAASGTIIRQIVESCREAGLTPLIMPEMASSLGTEVFKPRKIDIKDLLRRAPKEIDKDQISKLFSGETVLVTGAGGSIGSEICRQALTYKPKILLLLDNSEFNLYKIETELSESGVSPDTQIVPILGSAAEARVIDKLFEEYTPAFVLHAAAYKHVPMIESNPTEGIVNNILSTKILAEHAVKYGTKRFLLVSSDKAVHPTNIMGATKRCCELLILSYARTLSRGERDCKFSAVRFGNVLGSSGSVVPRFMEQIEKGGPVTVTHKDVTRYFMLNSEAVALVLQSMAMSKGGEIFVLNMGTPIKIYEMAEQLIWLCGHKPHQDIEISITGLRPGEKLFEELIIEDVESPSLHEDIFISQSGIEGPADILQKIEELLIHAKNFNTKKSVAIVKGLSSWRHGQSYHTKEDEQPSLH